MLLALVNGQITVIELVSSLPRLPLPPLPPPTGSIGMLLALVTGQITVIELVSGFPAANCGLINLNDALLSVDGANVEGWALPQVRLACIGAANDRARAHSRARAHTHIDFLLSILR